MTFFNEINSSDKQYGFLLNEKTTIKVQIVMFFDSSIFIFKSSCEVNQCYKNIPTDGGHATGVNKCLLNTILHK